MRWRVGLPGLFLMGVAYGIFNEGLIAKTLFYDNPGSMAHYPGLAPGRVQVVWATMICTWHALHAVIFPIALTSLAFSRVRRRSWLRVPVRVGLLVLVAGIGGLSVTHLRPEYATRAQLLEALLAIALLLAAASR